MPRGLAPAQSELTLKRSERMCLPETVIQGKVMGLGLNPVFGLMDDSVEFFSEGFDLIAKRRLFKDSALDLCDCIANGRMISAKSLPDFSNSGIRISGA